MAREMIWRLLLLIILPIFVTTQEADLLVRVKQGTLRGSLRKTWGGRSILAFQGIPYAEPPIGDRRFQPPTPARAWGGVLDATGPHAYCPQKDLFYDSINVFVEEDCLYLNVYTPTTRKLLPVIVYIHGGAFTSDSGNPDLYGPDILLDKDLVLVTINYRLGALGFLSLEDSVLPGNNGLKDQSLALRWVKDNIIRFGGNTGKVTIFGNSAGGASVYYHILSPLSKGLFHYAISSSGIATSSWAMAKRGEAKAQAIKLAKTFNCTTSSSALIIKCLQTVDQRDIVELVYKSMEFSYEKSIPYRPVIEPKLHGSFISDHPLHIIKSGKFNHVPYMNGVTTEDGAIKSAAIYDDDALVNQMDSEFTDLAPVMFYYDDQSWKRAASQMIKAFYFQNRSIDSNTKSQLTDLFTDGLFYYPQRAGSELHAKYSTRPVYFYLFGYRGSKSVSIYFGNPTYDYGVCHCDDLIYSLSNELFDDYESTQTDLNMNHVVTTLLYNFASFGNPTPGRSEPVAVKWEPIQNNTFKYLSIMGPTKIKMEEALYEERYRFWKKFAIFPEIENL
uniref:Carboxylic ester hydrolase n=1 Tax=Photinus pyralis TaxID=7054 RepID=A0A1Y1NDS8_PHOPY